jgi:hypothetical protein
VDPGDVDNVIVSAASSPMRSHGDVNPESYLYRRAGVQAWERIERGLPSPAGRHSAVLVAHPTEPGTFFAAWERDVFRSVDGGASWERLDVDLPDSSRVNEMCALVVAETEFGDFDFDTKSVARSPLAQ